MATITYSKEASSAIAAFTGCLNEDTLLDLAARFSDVYRDLAKTSLEHFLITPVTTLPKGSEKGKCLSIDVGGSNLRVGFVELMGEAQNGTYNETTKPLEKIRRSYDKSWPIEEHMKMDKAEDLFEWIGDCMAEVITDALDDMPASVASPFGDELLLGITFSFPMAQTSLSKATLLPMGKGFAITKDLDLGKMLSTGYSRHIAGIYTNNKTGDVLRQQSGRKTKLTLPRIRIAAIANDTVATFVSMAYTVKAVPNSRTAMGLIVGTGTNATVPMKLGELHTAKKEHLVNAEAHGTVVINTEWTIRGTDRPLIDLGIKTLWDKILDANSDAPGFQPFEYMTAGRYLGEIVRLVFVDVVSKDADVRLPPALEIRNGITTRLLSEMAASAVDETLVAELEERFPGTSTQPVFWTLARVQLMRDIAYAVQQRSSALIAAACVGLLDCVGDIIVRPTTNHSHDAHGGPEELVIAYTGGTISHYPDWLSTCQRWIDVLVARGSTANASKRVVLKEALDGGIIGAGVLAGMTDNIA